jgi:hypothetical protein
MIVTNRGLIISRFPGDFICSLFPSVYWRKRTFLDVYFLFISRTKSIVFGLPSLMQWILIK